MTKNSTETRFVDNKYEWENGHRSTRGVRVFSTQPYATHFSSTYRRQYITYMGPQSSKQYENLDWAQSTAIKLQHIRKNH